MTLGDSKWHRHGGESKKRREARGQERERGSFYVEETGGRWQGEIGGKGGRETNRSWVISKKITLKVCLSSKFTNPSFLDSKKTVPTEQRHIAPEAEVRLGRGCIFMLEIPS